MLDEVDSCVHSDESLFMENLICSRRVAKFVINACVHNDLHENIRQERFECRLNEVDMINQIALIKLNPIYCR